MKILWIQLRSAKIFSPFLLVITLLFPNIVRAQATTIIEIIQPSTFIAKAEEKNLSITDYLMSFNTGENTNYVIISRSTSDVFVSPIAVSSLDRISRAIGEAERNNVITSQVVFNQYLDRLTSNINNEVPNGKIIPIAFGTFPSPSVADIKTQSLSGSSVDAGIDKTPIFVKAFDVGVKALMILVPSLIIFFFVKRVRQAKKFDKQLQPAGKAKAIRFDGHKIYLSVFLVIFISKVIMAQTFGIDNSESMRPYEPQVKKLVSEYLLNFAGTDTLKQPEIFIFGDSVRSLGKVRTLSQIDSIFKRINFHDQHTNFSDIFYTLSKQHRFSIMISDFKPDDGQNQALQLSLQSLSKPEQVKFSTRPENLFDSFYKRHKREAIITSGIAASVVILIMVLLIIIFKQRRNKHRALETLQFVVQKKNKRIVSFPAEKNAVTIGNSTGADVFIKDMNLCSIEYQPQLQRLLIQELSNDEISEVRYG